MPKASTALAEVSTPNPIVSMIEKLIEQPDFNVDALTKMMELNADLQAQQARRDYHAAMSRVMGELDSIIKAGNTNNNSYALLGDILEALLPILAGNGLSWSCAPSTPEKGMVRVVATCAHVSGHEKTSEWSMPCDTSGSKNEVQSYGSTSTYIQRYLVVAHFSIATRDEGHQGGDNDGAQITYVDNDQASALAAAAHNHNVSKGRIFGYFSKKFKLNINSWEAFPAGKLEEVIAQIEKLAKNK